MLSEGIVYATAILPSPALCCLCASDQQVQCVSKNLFREMWQYMALYTAVVWPSAVTGTSYS